MRAPAKVGLVAAGYVAAVLVALATVSLYIAATDTPDRQASSGMYAFGDSLLFLAVFATAAVPATGMGLFFLRPYAWFWRVLSVGALLAATTAIAAAILYVATWTAQPGTPVGVWSSFSVLRILVAPIGALAFVLSALFTPSRSARIALCVAALLEALSFLPLVVAGLRG
jgi:hypothetical protein